MQRAIGSGSASAHDGEDCRAESSLSHTELECLTSNELRAGMQV